MKEKELKSIEANLLTSESVFRQLKKFLKGGYRVNLMRSQSHLIANDKLKIKDDDDSPKIEDFDVVGSPFKK